MSKSRKVILVVASILFIIFGLAGSLMAIIAFPNLEAYNIIHAAALPWEIYYGLLLVGSLVYLVLGVCGICFRNKPSKHTLLRGLCVAAFIYIIASTILWFSAYRLYTGTAIIEIILGLITAVAFMFSISGKPNQRRL